MQNSYFNLIFLFLFFLNLNSLGQICGTDEYNAPFVKNNPQKYLQIEKDIHNYLNNLFPKSGHHITIPVVFHIVYNDEIENIPDSVIYQQLEVLNKNIKILKCENNCSINCLDCFSYIENLQNNETKSDLIFLDPPYKEKNINVIIEKLLEKNILSKNGIIVIHRHKKDDVKLTDKLNIIDLRLYGISKIIFAN